MKIFTPLFQAVIAFCAFFSFQFGLVYFLLDAKIEPVKKSQARFAIELKEIKAGQAKLENKINKLIADSIQKPDQSKLSVSKKP